MSTILLTVASRALGGEGLSCFSPEIIVGSDDYLVLCFLGQLIDGLLNFEWLKGREVKAAKAKFYSFVYEQRQIEQRGGLRVLISGVFSFLCGQPVYRSRRFSDWVSISPEISSFSFENLRCNTIHILSFHCKHNLVLVFLMFVFADLPANSARGQGPVNSPDKF